MSETFVSDARGLPVFGVFAESLTLAGRHSKLFLLWSVPLGVSGMTLVALAYLLDGLSPWIVPASMALFTVLAAVLSASFSVSIHRLVLLPGEPPSGFPGRILSRPSWRYLRGYLAVLLIAAVPATAVGFLASVVPGIGIPVVDFFLPVILPYFAVQAVIAARQLIYLTDLSLHASGSWRHSTAMARGYRLRLIGVNLLSGVFTLGVSLFAGWVIGELFTSGPQFILEFFTVAAGMPAQVGAFACLQAACYRRLSLSPVA